MSSGGRCRMSSFARSAALRCRSASGGARSSASPRRCTDRFLRLVLGQLRHPFVSFQCRADRARMRSAHSGPGAQHPLAGGRRVKYPRERGWAHRSTDAPKNGEGRMSRIKTVLGLTVAAVMLLATAAQAQSNYPNRPIRIVVPYPAGGIVDLVARAVTEQVGRDWKQTVVVEARPGGNSNIGTAAVARSEPDGYTWLVSGPAALVNPTL